MVKVTAFFVLSALSLASAAPAFQKRIAQNTVDAKTAWEQACIAAGGGTKCNPIAVTAIGTLLAAAGPCAQQDSADAMIDLAKQLGNDAEMIRLAQIFVQQPRNAPDSLQVPYCQVAPKNAELNGLFHCQFAGSKFPNFSGDQTGNIPLGLNAPVNPAGSCPANPQGPIPDGVQLNTLVKDPGVPGATGGANNNDNGGAAGNDAPAPADDTSAPADDAPAPADTSAPPADAGASPAGTKPFTLQNGLDAQAQNAKFATLTADSPCTDGDNGCVGDAFAQCVGGKFVITPCAGGTICAALPLVNKAGTSVTCTTAADRDARIAATGATGKAAPASLAAAPAKAPAKATKPKSGSTAAAGAKSFTLQNGLDAKALNAKFATLSASSPCTDGENGCVGDAFAQCVGGKFVTTSCAGGTICAALPLVNKAGTSVTCTTAADRDARIAATGA